MKRTLAVCVCVAAMGAWSLVSRASYAQPQPLLREVDAIRLPGVAGRIDHLAFDAARQHLFIAALGNDTVEVVDTAKGAHLRSLSGFHEPQGIAVVPDLNAVAVANGQSGTLQLVDAQTFQTRWTVNIGGDADNVRYDATAMRLYVAAEGGLVAVDPSSGRVVQRISIAGHPESFQLESQGSRIFANLPGASQVVLADRKSMAVTARWPTGMCQANYPMALDESTARLFVGCRRPPRLVVLETTSGRTIGSGMIVGDTDDLFYDGPRKRLYVIGGEGFVDVLGREGDAVRRIDRMITRAGARTGLWVASQSRLYVAAPARAREPAEILAFEPAN